METLEIKNNNLPFDEFLSKLKQEYEYLKGYRKETAKLALDLVLKTNKATPFLDPAESMKIVSMHYPFHDKHRKDDIAKMLRIVANNVYLDYTTPKEVKDYVNIKLQNKAILKKPKK